VGNIADSAGESQVQNLFASQPGFYTCNYQARPGKPPFAFVQYMNATFAQNAKKALEGWPVNGKAIKVTYARSEMKPRSLMPPVSSYLPPGSVPHNPYNMCTIYITKLAMNTSEKQITKVVRDQPGFVTMHFTKNLPPKSSFVFAKFADPESAGRALTTLSSRVVNGKTFKVTFAKSEMKTAPTPNRAIL